jgi:hypothetical protein
MRVFDPSQVRGWRERAEECRTLADSFADENTRMSMLKVAAEYERMADKAEQLRQPAVSRGAL